MFGFKIVSKSEYEILKRNYAIAQSVHRCHRWFSGWTDLDIIWDYILSETYFGDVGEARAKYAKARGTDEYGNVKYEKV